MHEKQIRDIIRDAIMTANIVHPYESGGVVREQVYRSLEDSEHLALTVVAALEHAGFAIVPEPRPER